jgi:hypothetical protein
VNQLGTTTENLIDEREWDRVLSQLRLEGFSPIESIKITRAVLHKTLAESKRIVHFSEAWADLRDQFEQLHDEAAVAVESI